jgi:glycosyltransferase involved in cell wall biosynthesis
MTFKVSNIISAFNSKSGGPPRTVSLIAAAGAGLWQADLFTTDYLESTTDTLCVREFPGHVNLARAGAHSVVGGLSMVAGLDRGFRTQLLHGVKPDVVHVHGIWSPFLAAFALTAYRQGIPYIITPHGMLEPWSLSVRPLRKSLALKLYQRRMLANAAAIHATSRMEAANIARLRLGTVPVHVIPNAVDEPPHWTVTELPAPDRRRVLLFLSRIHPKKGLDMLLQAWAALRPANWRLRIVGSGEPAYAQKLKDFCAAESLSDVDFEEHLDGIAREAAFRRAAAFVLPTYSENFGNVVAEALIRGLPVLTTTGAPWSEIVARGCGWYVEPRLDAIQGALAKLVATDERELHAMGARGRAYAAKNFTLPVVRTALLGMYESVLKPPRRVRAQA